MKTKFRKAHGLEQHQKWLANSELALKIWQERVKPENVELDYWGDGNPNECGSTGCFGGHLSTWPEFVALGVSRQCCGAPQMVAGRELPANELYPESAKASLTLFGHSFMFESWHWASRGQTDHEEVVQRLKQNIDGLRADILDLMNADK